MCLVLISDSARAPQRDALEDGAKQHKAEYGCLPLVEFTDAYLHQLQEHSPGRVARLTLHDHSA